MAKKRKARVHKSHFSKVPHKGHGKKSSKRGK